MESILQNLGINETHSGTSTGQDWMGSTGSLLRSNSPVDGGVIGSIYPTSLEDYNRVMDSAEAAFKVWRIMPAPKRGEIVRQFGDELRLSLIHI